jgi:FtsP/CotA-like multicopper oxidase with cupredoxin domain
MMRQSYTQRTVLLLMVLAVAFLWTADQGIRAAAGGRADKVAAPAVTTSVSATAATTDSAAPAKSTTAAATTAAASPQKGQAKKQSATACTVNGQLIDPCPPGIRKQALRQAARQNVTGQKTGVAVQFAGVSSATAAISPLAQVGTGPTQVAAMASVVGPVDYFGVANWANSPLPTVTAAGLSGGIPKFVDPLASLLPALATPDITTFPGNDFYKIGLKEYTHVFSSAMPAASVRGYYDKGTGAAAQSYLGPLIVALRNRPTRVLFTNELTSDLNIPVDTTYMGAGMVSDGTNNNIPASQRRSSVHLHGGNTPWISDGTVHQWTTPIGGDSQPNAVGFAKGWSARNVPDMVPPLCVGTQCVDTTNSLTDGTETFYWTNQQSGRLLWFHDHAYGITRLNVYAGEAAGFLLADPAQETALKSATVPGTIATMADPTVGAPLGSLIPDLPHSDLVHLYPLVIQDKTFVPDPATQLATQDPTWDVKNWGGLGALWFPHVYSPNQNPADLTGANGFGRYDWGPWFWPPQDPTTLLLQAYTCTSSAAPTGGTWAFPPLQCPGVPDPTRPAPGNSPSSTPEAFMDTPLVNGVAYPTLSVDPAAYRFQVLNAANDRTLNLGLYVADPLTVSVAAAGSGYAATDTVAFTGCSTPPTTATLKVDLLGAITGVTMTGTPVCANVVTAAITTATGTGGILVASANTDVHMVPAIPAAAGRTLPNCGVSPALTLWGGGQVTTTLTTPTGLPDGGTGVPNCWPEYSSPQGFTAGTFGENGVLSWGNSDARTGGVPDPTFAGPPIIQIGAEGGLLPKLAVIPSTPISYDYNKRSITVLNVLNHGLLLGPAERADFIVDFTAFAGKTLIVYNDAPAPIPAGDPRTDYYTNDPDNSSTGGAPTTMAGYGPNTRTIMQITVNPTGTPNSPLFSVSDVQTALPALFASTQDPVIVPETVYPTANGGATGDTYARIQDTSMTGFLGGPIGAVTLVNSGTGYTSAPTVGFNGGGGTGAAATATISAASVASVGLTNLGSGYTSAPTVSLSGGGGTGATATAALAATGGVKTITVTSGGSGYLTAPTVVFSTCPTCVTPTATATVGTNGQRRVTAITLLTSGSGYSAAPTITFSSTSGSGAAATATLGKTLASVTVTNGGTNYTTAPTVAFSGGGGSGAAGTAVLSPRVVTTITVTNGGTGYTSAPGVTFTGGGGSGALATVAAPVNQILPKAIQELFTLDYGRMNATLGVEVPFTNFLTQTTIPYGYADPPTEIFKSGETQLWKITHNGVDTHFMHFHLFTVQVINRVGWDGAIKPPDPNEVGFKDTVRMNPLEDVIVALRPFRQTVPFAVPNSSRPMLVTQPVGFQSNIYFTNIDPENNPATVTNALVNFGWEYVWHCHILGHEENDMMRAMILAVQPTAPTVVAATGGSKGTTVLTISASATPATPVPTGFTVQRATNLAGPWTNLGSIAASLDPTGTTLSATFTNTGLTSKTTYYYQVVSNNLVGYTAVYAAPAVGYPHPSADSAAVTASAVAK